MSVFGNECLMCLFQFIKIKNNKKLKIKTFKKKN